MELDHCAEVREYTLLCNENGQSQTAWGQILNKNRYFVSTNQDIRYLELSILMNSKLENPLHDLLMYFIKYFWNIVIVSVQVTTFS
jgi:hypothetical protein